MPQRRPAHSKQVAAKKRPTRSGSSPRPVSKQAQARKRTAKPSVNGRSLDHSPSSSTLITRRRFLYGALGVGAVAAVTAGGVTLANYLEETSSQEEEIEVLSVPEEAVFSSDDCTELDPDACMALIGSFDFPYGTLVWAGAGAFAACLLPTEGSASPLTQVALLDLNTGAYPIVLEQAVGHAAGFDIYDVRASDDGLIWTEANILDEIWRIYAAPLTAGSLGEPRLVDEGDKEWETPTLAAVGGYAFWQVLPHLDGSKTSEQSLLKKTRFTGNAEPEVVYSSTGRMCTPPYAMADAVVITPRTNTSSINYQLTLIDAASSNVLDKMALPQSMRPLEAGYGDYGFMFSFDGIYNYGGGIANLGTYTPAAEHGTQDYNGIASWFRFAKTPSAPPAWCDGWLIVKSLRSVCGVNLLNRTYFPLATENGCDTYGDYLATSGQAQSIVTYTNIDVESIDGALTRLSRVRVWTPFASASQAATEASIV